MPETTSHPANKPRVRIVPPVYLLAAIAGMALLHFLAPGMMLIPRPWNWLGLLPFVGGLLLGGIAARLFARHKTTIKPGHVSSSLLTTGPFSWSRNPIYVAMTMLLAGVATRFGSLTPWLLVPAFVLVIAVNVIPVEEQMMAETFGADYERYRAHVRRWL